VEQVLSRSSPRSRLKIYYDVLRSIADENGRARFSHVLSSANLPYDRFIMYLSELEEKGFIIEERGNDGNYLVLTEKGMNFYRELRRMDYFLRGFGLSL
jgi:DtxR family manganese transport transcriptional regulator